MPRFISIDESRFFLTPEPLLHLTFYLSPLKY